jgi:hypothetical protein
VKYNADDKTTAGRIRFLFKVKPMLFSNGAIENFSNLLTAISTLAIAFFTTFLWFENRRLRKAGSEPDVVSYVAPTPSGNGAIEFILANVGNGPAFQVTFSLDYDEADFEEHRVYLMNDLDRMPISVLPQGEKIRALLGVGFELYGLIGGKNIGTLKPFHVSIEFTNSIGQKRKAKRTIDVRQFSGLRGLLQKTDAAEISKSLREINESISQIARQSARFSAFVDITQINDSCLKKAKGGLGSPPHADLVDSKSPTLSQPS